MTHVRMITNANGSTEARAGEVTRVTIEVVPELVEASVDVDQDDARAGPPTRGWDHSRVRRWIERVRRWLRDFADSGVGGLG